jgi:acyl-CoA thioester hydrolase
MTPILAAEIPLEVPFHDVDSMGVVWHGHYVKYLELARTALLRRAGLDFGQMGELGVLWPVATCRLKYVRPLRYGQRVQVRAELLECANRLRVRYLITDAETGERTTSAETVQLAVKADTGELLFDTPPEVQAAIARAAS